MKAQDRFSLNQLLALCSMLVLTPALRLLPGASARLAGRAGRLSVLTALPFVAAYAAFLWHFQSLRLSDETLPSLWQRALGARVGALTLAAAALWLLFYAGFTLRAGAERLVTTVFPLASRRTLPLPLALIAAVAGAGEARRLCRVAKLVLPLLIGTILLTLAFSLPELHKANLLPLGLRAFPRVLRGSLPTFDAAALALSCLFFLSDGLTAPGRRSSVFIRIALLGILMSLLVAAVIGALGHELAGSLTRPYFTLVRTLVFFYSLERIEALIVALWLFADFLLLATLMLIARRCLAPLWKRPADSPWLKLLCGALPPLLAVLLAPEAEAYAQLSRQIVPAVNLVVCLLMIPGVYVVGRLRKRL